MKIEKHSLRSFTLAIVALAGLVIPAWGSDSAEESSVRRPKLQIINGSEQKISVFWLKSATERIPNGTVEPGKDTIITTTLGHRFEIVGPDRSQVVTSEVPIQGVRFDSKAKDGIPAFYTQRVYAHGFPIVASAKVNPYALKEAAFLVDKMLEKRPDVRTAMIKSDARMCVEAYTEYTTDLPEFAYMANEPEKDFPELTGKEFWDARARGLGGSETDPLCTVAEENVLGYPGDPYVKECILIHEFAHNMHLRGMLNVDPTFDARLRATYDAAMKAGLWKGKYASLNHHEYFAEGVQSWFDDNRVNDHDHNHVHLRSQLIEYDPGLAAICREVYGDTKLTYTKPATRLTDHMAGYDPSTAPTFEWPEHLKKAKALIKAHAQKRDARARGVEWQPAVGSETAASFVSEKAIAGYFPLVLQKGLVADILVDTNDFKVAQIAAADLVADIERVTGQKPALKQSAEGLQVCAVLVGTLGKSPLIDLLVKEKKIDVKDVQGLWESFVIAGVSDPLPGVKQALVIAGSDRRGTAYGVYELSKRIGVSPWYWWADVTPLHRESLYVSPERLRVGPPAVKYRGIFINDEMWGLRPWAMKNFAPEEGHGLGPRTHAKIFELLLRLRANHLWPAMHNGDGGTIPFNCYEQNKVVADDYAIVMGSSHIEPMLRNNISGAEWDREYPGEPWDYTVNKAHIYKYWEDRVKANGKYENVYTMGKRGKDDEPGKEVTVPLLEQIIADQRSILAKWATPDVTRVPQVLIAYTEVLNLYNQGLKLPEDIIFCWPDDNFGYIRQLPDVREQKRSGGSGVYYHIQWLNGATTAYPWLNTTPPALIWEEMNKAFQYGADKLWVLNVGDIKPGEIGMEFFLDMAWDPKRYGPDNVREFLVRWAARDLDPRFAEEVASIMEDYYRLGLARRPEHLVQAKGKNPLSYSWFSHTHSNDEAMQRVEAYEALSQRAQAIYDQLPTLRKDAFFQFVFYPVQCASLINAKVIYADKSSRYGAEGRASASEYAVKARAAAQRIIELTDHYNTGLLTVSNKWKLVMSPAPGPWGTQFRQFEMPPLSDYAGKGPAVLGVALEGGDPKTLADMSVYTQGRRFIDLYNAGTGKISWSATPSQPWVKLDLTSGTFTTERRVWITIDWNQVPKEGLLVATLEIKSSAGNKQITIPLFKPAVPAREEVKGYVESHGYVSMEAEHFTRRESRGGAAWEVVKGLGRSGDSVTVLPANVPSATLPQEIVLNSPSLEYDIHLFSSGEATLTFDCLPTKAVHPKQGVRLAYSINGGEPQIVTGQGGDVLSNLRRLSTKVIVATPGKHTLKVWMVDPGVVIDKLVLSFKPLKETYLGPLESYHR